jgi:haloalkane dehalogenase
MWRDVLPALGEAGFHALAPDFLGFGDSPDDRPHTWTRQVEALEEWRSARGLERVALVVHDWGGLIGLRWAVEHQDAVTALAISGTGFFPDGKWHGLAQVMRQSGGGEEIVDNIDLDGFTLMLQGASRGITPEACSEYFKAYRDADRRRAQLELYRSGNFEELAPYEGALAAMNVPTLLLWGADDPFAPVASLHRFTREIPHAESVILEGAGHFVFEDEPDRCAREVVAFVNRSLR